MSIPVDQQVSDFIDQLQSRFIGRWWPKYIFHFAEIRNAVNIFKSGKLYGRKSAIESGLLISDTAEKSVLDHTFKKYQDFARLYFKPKAPPLFTIEGFKSRDEGGPHCPVPVYLLFDSKLILSIPNVEFSDGNLGSSSHIIYSDKEELSKLNFELIYHDTYFRSDEEKKRIIHHRCAEVIIPKFVQLDGYLRKILCRSYAERETLINLLPSNLKAKYSQYISVYPQIFCRNRPYIEKVELTHNLISYNYYVPDSYSDKSFEYKYCFFTESRQIELPEHERVRAFKWPEPPGNYTVKVLIDDNIAFLGNFTQYDLPF